MTKDNNNIVKPLLLAIILIAIFSNANAAIYKYIDESGQVHYSETKPDSHSSEELKVKSSPVRKKNSENTSSKPADLQGDSCGESGEYVRYRQVFCCNINCVRNRIKKGLEVNCEDQRCHQAAFKIKNDIEMAAKREREAKRKKIDKKNLARMNESIDKKLIAECKKRREIYCNKGADEIRRIQAEEAKRQQESADQDRRWKANHPDLGPRINSNDVHIN